MTIFLRQLSEEALPVRLTRDWPKRLKRKTGRWVVHRGF